MAKHRDKARIKPFCDQLAQLWEIYGPDLRFGQIISCLPLSIDRPGHDPFFVEEDEMLEALQHTFSQEGKAARTLDTEQLDGLKDRWEDLLDSIYDAGFQTEDFKSLFLDTWSYSRDAVDCYGVPHKVVPLVAFLGKFNGNNQYPAHTPPWEVDVCGKFVDALLYGLENPLRPCPSLDFYGGGLVLEPYMHQQLHVTPETFEKVFTELAEEYRENDYEGGYDYYEQENLPFPYEEEE